MLLSPGGGVDTGFPPRGVHRGRGGQQPGGRSSSQKQGCPERGCPLTRLCQMPGTHPEQPVGEFCLRPPLFFLHCPLGVLCVKGPLSQLGCKLVEIN